MTSISFCIATSGTYSGIQEVIDSIQALNIPEYEVIVVGGDSPNFKTDDFVRHIPFDENRLAPLVVNGFPAREVSRKKNIAARAAKYEVVVIMNDYIKFYPNWYEEFEKFGTHWDICVHQCLNYLGGRADGWRVENFPGLPWGCMVPYDMQDLVQYMGIQGNYHVVKREWYLAEPLDDNRLWGQEEEMEWCRRIMPKSHVVCNPNCIIQYNKPKEWDQRQCTFDVEQMNAHQHIFDIFRSCRIQNHKLNNER